MKSFSPAVRRALGHYVYLYLDPATGEVFYVGKGRGNRAFHHLDDTGESAKAERIRASRAKGGEPVIEILAHGLPDEMSAYRVEAAAIDLIGVGRLTNAVRGLWSRTCGRMTAEQIAAHYGAAEVEIEHPVLLIRINRLFRHGMTPVELYDAARGIWKLGPRRELARYAFAVFEGVVQEVYRIRGWYPAGHTLSTRDDLEDPDRWEFVGGVAEPEVRDRCRYGSVKAYLKKGSQNPITYVNCDG